MGPQESEYGVVQMTALGTTVASDQPLPSDALSGRPGSPSTKLRQTLKECHVNMIGFSTMVGIGLFLSGGKALAMAGPGGAVAAYIVTGTIMASSLACLAEMTALFPVRGAIFEFSRRFVDESVGFAVGWMSWFDWVIILTSEIQAVAQLFKFKFEAEYLREKHYPHGQVQWKFGENTSAAVWIGIFLVITLLFNLLPVRQYGRMEYIFGSVKMVFLVGIILFNTILNARQDKPRFWTYRSPYGLLRDDFVARPNPDGSLQIVLHGTLGRFTAFWTAMTITLFSLIGLDIILYTAPENQDLQKDETIKLATRKLSIRTITIYVLVTFTVGLNVPFNDGNIQESTILSVPGGQNSTIIIAAIREHVKGFPHFFNAFFIFAACSCGINCLYASSRALHALAMIRGVWPNYYIFNSLRRRLATTRMGVPMNAVTASWLVAFLAFLSVNSSQSVTLGRMTTVAVVSSLLVHAVNCVAYLNFYRHINAAASGAPIEPDLNVNQGLQVLYDRGAPRFPYKTHLQWLRAAYALAGCVLFLIFHGWRSLLSPVSANDFVASYIPLVLFLALSAAYFIKGRGIRPRNWRRFAIGLTGLNGVGPIQVSEQTQQKPCDFCGAIHRRGYLNPPDEDIFTAGNFRAFVEWLWTWTK